MQKDIRICQMAKNIVKNSVNLKKGETVFIEGIGLDCQPLFEEIIVEATKAGATPFYFLHNEKIEKCFFENANESQVNGFSDMHEHLMKKADAYIAVRAYDNVFDMSDLSAKQQKLYDNIFYNRVHFSVRVPKTRWCVMRYPNNVMAVLNKMSTKEFEDFYFNACLTDYSKMAKAQEKLVSLLKKTDKVKIVAPNTNIEFSIKGINVKKSCGHHNLPDGEVFTAPVKNSISGYIQFNTPTIESGYNYANIFLEFKDGKIIKATSDYNNKQLQKVIKSDEGACYMGEFALGLNPYITEATGEILFDEKIAGSIHMAIGSSYDDACNTNKSCVHWDLVQIQTPEKGGGEIYFDGKLIRKDGVFVIKELECLNPENLI